MQFDAQRAERIVHGRDDRGRRSCLPTIRSKPPAGRKWIHEIKHDGYRMIVRRDGDRVRLSTRRGHDWTHRFDWIVRALHSLPVKSVTIDGEMVVCDDNGISVFAKLHSQSYDGQAILYAFDLLELNGEDYRREPLEKRKAKLAKRDGTAEAIVAQKSSVMVPRLMAGLPVLYRSGARAACAFVGCESRS